MLLLSFQKSRVSGRNIHEVSLAQSCRESSLLLSCDLHHHTVYRALYWPIWAVVFKSKRINLQGWSIHIKVYLIKSCLFDLYLSNEQHTYKLSDVMFELNSHIVFLYANPYNRGTECGNMVMYNWILGWSWNTIHTWVPCLWGPLKYTAIKTLNSMEAIGGVVLYCKRMIGVPKKQTTAVFYKTETHHCVPFLHTYNFHILKTCLLMACFFFYHEGYYGSGVYKIKFILLRWLLLWIISLFTKTELNFTVPFLTACVILYCIFFKGILSWYFVY